MNTQPITNNQPIINNQLIINNQQNINYNLIKNDLVRIRLILGIINLPIEEHGLSNSLLALVNKIDIEIDNYNNTFNIVNNNNLTEQQNHNQQLQTVLNTVQNYIIPH